MSDGTKLIPVDYNNADHIAWMWTVRTNDQVDKQLRSQKPKDFSYHARYIKDTIRNNKKLFYLIIGPNNEKYGYCQSGITAGKAGVEVGWALHPDHWGKGIGTAAVTLLIQTIPGEREVWLTVKYRNSAARHIYSQAGFFAVAKSDEESVKMTLARHYA